MAESPAERALVLDVGALRVFRELVAEGGFTAASRKLGITQPAVSIKIRRLEERIGVRLIAREGRSFTVTAHGRDLLAHAEEIVEAHDRAVDSMRRSSLRGALRLGCSGAVAAGQLSEIMSRFKRTQPEVDLTIRVSTSAVVGEMLDNSEVDVAVLHLLEDNVRPADVVWHRDDLHIVEGLGADFAGRDALPVVSFGPRDVFSAHLTAALEGAGCPYWIAVEWPNVRGVQNTVEAGLGVGILNSANVTDKMRPWAGADAVELDQAVFVVRSRPHADGNALIEALMSHLSAIPTSVRPV